MPTDPLPLCDGLLIRDFETPQTAVENLAFLLGWSFTALSGLQRACVVESIAILAKSSGVPREAFLRPFEKCRGLAEQAWEKYL